MLLRHLGLLLQRLQLATQLGEHVREAQQILVEPGELALGALLAAPVLRDPRGLLDVLATILRLGEEHLLELALPHHGVQRAADAGLAEQLLHVEQPHDLAVDAVLGLSPERKIVRETSISLIGTGILPGGVVDHELDLGHAERGARRRARRRSRRPCARRGAPGRPARRAPS